MHSNQNPFRELLICIGHPPADFSVIQEGILRIFPIVATIPYPLPKYKLRALLCIRIIDLHKSQSVPLQNPDDWFSYSSKRCHFQNNHRFPELLHAIPNKFSDRHLLPTRLPYAINRLLWRFDRETERGREWYKDFRCRFGVQRNKDFFLREDWLFQILPPSYRADKNLRQAALHQILSQKVSYCQACPKGHN